MKSKGNGLARTRPGMKNKKVDTGNIGKKGTVVNFDTTKKPGHRFSLPDDSVNDWTYALAEFSGDPRCVRKIINRSKEVIKNERLIRRIVSTRRFKCV